MSKDGFKIDIPEVGFNDEDLVNVFDSNTVYGVLENFGQKLIADVRQSLDSKGKNATGRLNQSLSFDLKIMGSEFTFSFAMADYWRYVDEGVNGSQTAYNTPHKFTGSGLDKEKKFKELVKWVRVKSVFGGLDTKDAEGLAFGIMKKQRKFGIKPSNFYSDVINDGRLIELQAALERAATNDIKGFLIST